jgi:hypothetical protein
MIWLAWRQFRTQAITAAAALVLFAVVLVLSESRMSGLYNTSGLTTCHGGSCAGLASQFLQSLTSGRGVSFLPDGSNEYVILYFISVLVILVAPAIIGIFWGAPLIARELESGTFRLAWNQSVTRNRWLTVKLALIGVAAMAVSEGFSLLQAWWAAPIGKAIGFGGSASILTEGRFGPFVFPSHGITPLGYAAFGFVLGVTAGLLIRRAVPAMAVTVAVFAIVQLITPLWIRPDLIPPDRTIATITAAGAAPIVVGDATITMGAAAVPGHPGAWITSTAAVNAAGQPTGLPVGCQSAVPQLQGPGGSPRLSSCLSSHGVRVAISYHPVSSYWPLQFAEAGLFLALALALTWYCFWRLDRRRS